MDPARFTRDDAMTWRIEPSGPMRVPAIIYADEDLIRGMDDKVYDQVVNVAVLPGIVTASYVMPDDRWGCGLRCRRRRRGLGGRRGLRHFVRRAHHIDGP